MQQPSTVQGKTLDSPDETRQFENGKTDVVSLGEITVGRAVFKPGWRRSENVKPIASIDSCQIPHVGYVISRR